MALGSRRWSPHSSASTHTSIVQTLLSNYMCLKIHSRWSRPSPFSKRDVAEYAKHHLIDNNWIVAAVVEIITYLIIVFVMATPCHVQSGQTFTWCNYGWLHVGSYDFSSSGSVFAGWPGSGNGSYWVSWGQWHCTSKWRGHTQMTLSENGEGITNNFQCLL